MDIAKARRKILVKARCEGKLDDCKTEHLIKVLRKNFSYEYLVLTFSIFIFKLSDTTAQFLSKMIFCGENLVISMACFLLQFGELLIFTCRDKYQ